jgi:hypothetical protein
MTGNILRGRGLSVEGRKCLVCLRALSVNDAGEFVTEVKACTRLLSQMILLPASRGALDDWLTTAKACTDAFVLKSAGFTLRHL